MRDRVNAPTCPNCGRIARTKDTRYGERHDCCGMHSWRGKELVTPETHVARQVAHAVFDPLWQEGQFKRKDAYFELALELDIPLRDCHMSLLKLDALRRVPELAAKIRARGPRSRYQAIEMVATEQRARGALAADQNLCACFNRISKRDTALGVTTCVMCQRKAAERVAALLPRVKIECREEPGGEH